MQKKPRNERLRKEIKKVHTVGRSWQRKECRELLLTSPKLTGRQFNTEANFRTVPVKHDSDIQNR